MIALTKSSTRQGYALFWGYVWSEGDRRAMQQWLKPVTWNLLVMREGTTDKISVWYNNGEWQRVNQRIAENLEVRPQWWTMIRQTFLGQWRILLPYLTEQREINNLLELKFYYQAWVDYWPTLVIVMELPEMTGVPSVISADAMVLRRKVAAHSDDGWQVIERFLVRNFPQYVELARLMTPGELFDLSDHLLTAAETTAIQARGNGWALLNGWLLKLFNLKKEMREQGLTLAAPIQTDSLQEIKGDIASPGRVIGRVRLAITEEAVDLVQAGEILVTEMTTPDFVPAMRRAAGIVTDEGGVTCHAAIIARELKKPCVVGTKIATQLLKNGDKVEVDAIKGIVRILA